MSKKESPIKWLFLILIFIFVFLETSAFAKIAIKNSRRDYVLLLLFTFVAIILITSLKKGWIFTHTCLIHAFGEMIGGFLSGYSFSAFTFAGFRLGKHKGRLKLRKYPESNAYASCTMKPPVTNPENCPYRLHMFGGTILLILFSIVGMILYYQFDRHPLAYILLFWPSIPNALFVVNMLTTNAVSPISRSFKSFPANPSLRIAKYYAEVAQCLLFECDSIDEIPEDLIEKVIAHDCDILTDISVVTFYDIRSRFHCHRKEFEAERHCFELVYNANDSFIPLRLAAGINLLFDELTNQCRSEVIKQYFDKTVWEYFKNHPKSPSTKRILYAYYLLYLNNPYEAQREYSEFERIIATYPNKIDVDNEWDAIHTIWQAHAKRTAVTQ